MKIKVVDKSYEEVCAISPPPHIKPKKPTAPFRLLMKKLAAKDVSAARLECHSHGMEKLLPDEPCLILMNHSSFIDLEIASHYFYPRPLSIVCTSDGFVGKEWLMRSIGCIPTQKFVPDLMLVKDIAYALRRLKCSVLMYPEASYTFDGTATPLPDTLGKLIKMLAVPVVTVLTHGAFLRDPLYNGLQIRDVKVSADISYFMSPPDILTMTVGEINQRLREAFTFDNFSYQFENKIKVKEPFRADGLERVLYKCPHCGSEGHMCGKGTILSCTSCGARYELTEYGRLKAVDGEEKFTHIPDWYAWERAAVTEEIKNGSYRLNADVGICMMVDYKAVYRVGRGHLVHDTQGFHLTGCDGKLSYERSPLSCYSLYADYYWYEIGDMICIGDTGRLYYCFPEVESVPVAKTRIAAEIMYSLKRHEVKQEKNEKNNSSKTIETVERYASDILSSNGMQSEKGFIQHGEVNCYEHSLGVACVSVNIAQRLCLSVDMRSLVRGALLHDYFLYDWHVPDRSHKMHGFIHAKRALENASRDFALSGRERDIIAKHMFPMNPAPPGCIETIIVIVADKLCTVRELLHSN